MSRCPWLLQCPTIFQISLEIKTVFGFVGAISKMGHVVVWAPRRLQDINSVILPSPCRPSPEDPPSKQTRTAPLSFLPEIVTPCLIFVIHATEGVIEDKILSGGEISDRTPKLYILMDNYCFYWKNLPFWAGKIVLFAQ